MNPATIAALLTNAKSAIEIAAELLAVLRTLKRDNPGEDIPDVSLDDLLARYERRRTAGLDRSDTWFRTHGRDPETGEPTVV